jgi:hypothetical protein
VEGEAAKGGPYCQPMLRAKDPVQVDTGPMPSSAWAGWICFESEMEVEAAKGVPYRRPMLGAVKLLSKVYSSC